MAPAGPRPDRSILDPGGITPMVGSSRNQEHIVPAPANVGQAVLDQPPLATGARLDPGVVMPPLANPGCSAGVSNPHPGQGHRHQLTTEARDRP